MKRSFKALTKRQKGIAMVEFAISMPVIIFLLYCIGEIGRIQMMSNTLAKSVRDGARYLAENATRGTTGIIDISDEVTLETSSLVVYGIPVAVGAPVLDGFSVGDVQVSDLGDNVHIRVSATYDFTPIFNPQIPTFGIMDAPISLEFPLQATVTMRALDT